MVEFGSYDEDVDTKLGDEGTQQCPSSNCMDVVPEKVVHYLEFTKKLMFKLEK